MFKASNSTDSNSEGDEDDNKNGDPRLKFPTLLPTFSKKIVNCLQNGDVWLNNSERAQLVTELAIFYSTSAIVLQKQCHYKAVILTLFSKYNKFKEEIISIADSENKTRSRNLAQPWVNLKF